MGGATYFRRWNRLRAISGSLLVHKGVHSFDILNWLADSRPKRVAAFAGLSVFKPEPGRGERCLTCENRCPEYTDLASGPRAELYLAAEREDGYIADVCLYNSEKDTHDNATVIIEYQNGLRASYSDSFFCSRSSRRYLVIGELAEIEADSTLRRLRVYHRRSKDVTEYQLGEPPSGHGGGDEFQTRSFVRNVQEERPGEAGAEAGLWGVVVGEAAERAYRERRVVETSELIDPDYKV